MTIPNDQWWVDVVGTCSRFVRTTQSLAGHAPSSTTWRILATLDREGALRPGQLAERERSTQATTSKIIARLSRDGLVTSAPDPNDRRSQLVTLTDAGRAQLAANRAELVAALRPVLGAITDDQLADIDRGMRALNALVDAQQARFASR